MDHSNRPASPASPIHVVQLPERRSIFIKASYMMALLKYRHYMSVSKNKYNIRIYPDRKLIESRFLLNGNYSLYAVFYRYNPTKCFCVISDTTNMSMKLLTMY